MKSVGSKAPDGAGDLKRVIFALFPKDLLEDFVDRKDRHEEVIGS